MNFSFPSSTKGNNKYYTHEKKMQERKTNISPLKDKLKNQRKIER